MLTPSISLLFTDGIVSVTAMCFKLLMPVIIVLIALLSWEKIAAKEQNRGEQMLTLAGITLLLLDGVYLVYLMLSYPRSDMAQLYLSYRKEAGIFLGLVLLAFYGYRLLNLSDERLSPPWLPFVTAALLGLVLTATWAPCIREAVASISVQESGRLPFFFAYITGLTLPFLVLSLAAFGLKFLVVTEENARRFSTIGIILLILLSLTKIFMG